MRSKVTHGSGNGGEKGNRPYDNTLNPKTRHISKVTLLSTMAGDKRQTFSVLLLLLLKKMEKMDVVGTKSMGLENDLKRNLVLTFDLVISGIMST